MIKFLCISAFMLLLVISVSGQANFSNATAEMGIEHIYKPLGFMGSGISSFDYNNDNAIDLFFTGGYDNDKLFRNNGDGTFTDVTASAGLSHPDTTLTIAVVTGDLDNDGFRDIFITTRSATPPLLWKNNGDGTFTDISETSGIRMTSDAIEEDNQSYSASMGDYNLDGFLDIYMVNWIDTLGYLYDSNDNISGFAHQCAPNRLYLNNGDMTFTEVADILDVKDLGCGLATTFTDYDNDADMDILIANDFGQWVIPDALYQNNYPQNSFSNLSESSGFDSQLYGMGIGVGDYDQDGDLDYYKTNIGRNVLMNNQGDGNFIEAAELAGVKDEFIDGIFPNLSIGWGAGFVDIDHDSYLDLIVANGRVGSPDFFPSQDSMVDRLFKNNGDGTFTDITFVAGLIQYGLSRGFSYADLDNDGDMEIIFSCVPNVVLGLPASPVIFKNNLNNNKNWLKVKLVGSINNQDAFGSHIEIYVGGKSWLHEISGGGQGHNSQHTSIAHFGLDENTVVDSLIVRWLGHSTEDQKYYNLDVNQMIEIKEGFGNFNVIHTGSVSASSPTLSNANIKIYPNPFNDQFNLEYDLTKAALVNIDLLSLEGQLISNVLNSFQPSGAQKVKVTIDRPAGMYFIRLTTASEVVLRKVLLVK